MKSENFYTSSEYTSKNPNYHAEDAPHKWNNFKKCLIDASKKKEINFSSIKSVCEIGCGTGGILNQLKNSKLFDSIDNIEGWDINPSAIKIAKNKYPNFKFFDKDLFETDNKYDLMLCADVFEHVENPYSFLKNLSKTSKYFLFNIPIELSLLAMLQGKKIFKKANDSVGHVNFYCAATANLIIELNGYEIINKRFAKNRSSNIGKYKSFKTIIATIPQLFIETFSPYFSSVLMGDHLVILAKSNNFQDIR